jgi:ACT domain-containing protein
MNISILSADDLVRYAKPSTELEYALMECLRDNVGILERQDEIISDLQSVIQDLNQDCEILRKANVKILEEMAQAETLRV